MSSIMKKVVICGLFILTASVFIAASGQSEAVDTAEEPQVKIAVIFPGSIKDLGWNQDGYEALKEAETRYDIITSYQENVSAGEIKDVLRSYASDGYDLIIGHDTYFADPVIEVAAEFPDTMFGISFGWKSADNVVALSSTNWQNTYLAGALAGFITETGAIGILTATESAIAQKMVKGFKAGAAAANPDIKVVHAFVGGWNDVVKGKELVRSMVKENVDVVYTQAGQTNIGAIEAAQEAGIYAIGSIVDMSDVAPETVMGSAVSPPGAFVRNMIDTFINGTLEGKTYIMGIKEGVEDLVLSARAEEILTEDTKRKIDSLRQDIIDGKIQAPEL